MESSRHPAGIGPIRQRPPCGGLVISISAWPIQEILERAKGSVAVIRPRYNIEFPMRLQKLILIFASQRLAIFGVCWTFCWTFAGNSRETPVAISQRQSIVLAHADEVRMKGDDLTRQLVKGVIKTRDRPIGAATSESPKASGASASTSRLRSGAGWPRLE